MAILTSIKSKQPDVVFYGGMDAQGGLIARQMKQLGITAKLLGTDGLCTNEVAKISGGAVDDLLYCTRGGKEIEKTSKGAEFEQRYKARFGVEVLTYAPYLYDAMMALAAGMRAANSVEPEAYLPAMRKVKFDGVTGSHQLRRQGQPAEAGLHRLHLQGRQARPRGRLLNARMRTLNAAETAAALPYGALVEALLQMFERERRGEAHAAPRTSVPLAGGGVLLLMPAADARFAALKTVTVHAGNAAIGLPVVQGEVTLMDAAPAHGCSRWTATC
jgi:hypothetical protein